MYVSALRRIPIVFAVAVATFVLLALSSGDTLGQGPVHTTYNDDLQEDGDNLPTLGPPAECGDAADNDGDTLTDSADPDCLDWTPRFTPVYDGNLCMGLANDFNGPAGLKGPNPYPGGCGPDKSAALSSNPDVTTDFTVPQGHYNYAQDSFVSFLPPSFDVASDADIPDGSAVAGLQSTTTLGLTNNQCDNTVFPDFLFWDATTDITNVVTLPVAGTAARFDGLASDGDDAWSGQADSDSPIVTQYPDVGNKLFDPDGSGDPNNADPYLPVKPHARYASLSQVPPGGEYQLLQIYVFAPGALQAAFSANPNQATHPFTNFDPSLGWAHVTILNDPIAEFSSVNPITDFCTVLSTRTGLLGMADTDANGTGDVVRLTAPSVTGTYIGRQYSQSMRDLDGDGLETDRDTCQNVYNLEDPYATPGADGDMLDPACDPDPNTAENFGDIDNDGYANAQDVCPQTFNPNQVHSELTVGRTTSAYDGGPNNDSQGDACDANPTDGTQALFLQSVGVQGMCIGGTDADNDGFCEPESGSAATQDADGDTYPDETEEFMSTDPFADCPKGSKHQSWPPDFDANGSVNILDIVQLTPPVFNTSAGDADYTKRKDLNADGNINILDIVKLTPPVFNTSCTVQPFALYGHDEDGDDDLETLEVRMPTGCSLTHSTGGPATITCTNGCGIATNSWTVGVGARIRAATGDTVDVAKAECASGAPLAEVAPPAFGPKNYKAAENTDDGSGNFVCTFDWTDANQPPANIRAYFSCSLKAGN